ncbi:MAG TPA: hypothetical protein VFD25_05575 [Clostridia bacterium]|nr:hypothetical protein [Clostridia bacterium]
MKQCAICGKEIDGGLVVEKECLDKLIVENAELKARLEKAYKQDGCRFKFEECYDTCTLFNKCDMFEWHRRLIKEARTEAIKEFAEKLRTATDKIMDTYGVTEPNLYTKVYVRKPAVLDCINELAAEYGVEDNK